MISPEIYLCHLRGFISQHVRQQTVQFIISPAPSPQESIFRSTGESQGGGGGARSYRAKVAHQPGASNPTLLPFSKGEMITVKVQQPKNGWLYGRAESSSR